MTRVLVMVLITAVTGQLHAQSSRQARSSEPPTCAYAARQIDDSLPWRGAIHAMMRCNGDRYGVAERLWSARIEDETSLAMLQDATVEYVNNRILPKLATIARSDSSAVRRFAAFGMLARIVRSDWAIRPEDAKRWSSPDSTKRPWHIPSSTHLIQHPSPAMRPLAMQEIRLMAELTAYDDARRITALMLEHPVFEKIARQ